ncbi:MAG: hypothetical protein QXU87_09365 [Candidatus Caldarchaeum sp.]
MIGRRDEYEYLLLRLRRQVNGEPYYGCISVVDVETRYADDIGLETLRKHIKKMIDNNEVKQEGDLLIFTDLARSFGPKMREAIDKNTEALKNIELQVSRLQKELKAEEALMKLWIDKAPTAEVVAHCVEFWSSIINSNRQRIAQLLEKKDRIEKEIKRIETIMRKSFIDVNNASSEDSRV